MSPMTIAEMNAKMNLNQQQISALCNEWADDHTFLQGLCVEAGYTQEEVEGDGYAIRSIQGLATMLVEKLGPAPKIESVDPLSKNNEPICHICGKVAGETEGYLEKVKLNQPPPVWECRPICKLSDRLSDAAIDALIAMSLREGYSFDPPTKESIEAAIKDADNQQNK